MTEQAKPLTMSEERMAFLREMYGERYSAQDGADAGDLVREVDALHARLAEAEGDAGYMLIDTETGEVRHVRGPRLGRPSEEFAKLLTEFHNKRTAELAAMTERAEKAEVDADEARHLFRMVQANCREHMADLVESQAQCARLRAILKARGIDDASL